MGLFTPGVGDKGFVISFYAAPKEQFGAFAKGYRQAADLLARDLLDQTHIRDYQAYPLVFLYRHSFELGLKNIIYKAMKLAMFRDVRQIDYKLHNCHNLTHLSNRVVEIMKILFSQDNIPLAHVLVQVQETALALSEIDPESFSFRYPIDKSGKYSTKKGLVLGVSAMARHMSLLLDKLETIDFGLNVELDDAQKLREVLQGI